MSGDGIQVECAQLPERDHSDDKVFTTPSAVIVLDGASAFRLVSVPASVYADHLGRGLRDELTTHPEADLRAVLHTSIERTASELELVPGSSPSSTVAILRRLGDHVDGLVLGDSPIIFPSGVFADDRIDALQLPQRAEYQHRLAAGWGYDEHHRQLLEDLQSEQALRCNVAGGYWIAAADPVAAGQALTTRHRVEDAPWVVLATDGAFNTMRHLGLDDWEHVAGARGHELFSLLEHCQRWEAEQDPDGRALPRAKPRDDKAVAVVSPS